jgi:hypothetical protein
MLRRVRTNPRRARVCAVLLPVCTRDTPNNKTRQSQTIGAILRIGIQQNYFSPHTGGTSAVMNCYTVVARRLFTTTKISCKFACAPWLCVAHRAKWMNEMPTDREHVPLLRPAGLHFRAAKIACHWCTVRQSHGGGGPSL